MEVVTAVLLLPVLLAVTRYRDLDVKPHVWTVRQNRDRP